MLLLTRVRVMRIGDPNKTTRVVVIIVTRCWNIKLTNFSIVAQNVVATLSTEKVMLF